MTAKTSKNVSQAIKPVYVISGQSGRFRDGQLAELRKVVLEGCDWSMCLRQFDTEQAEISEVLDELRTLPFLGPRRVVELQRADGFVREHRQVLEEYLASPSTTAVLVLLLDKPLAGNLRLTKVVNRIGDCRSTELSKGQDVSRVLIEQAKAMYGKSLGRDAGRALRELTGDSLNALSEELEKLALYVGERSEITIEDVQALVGQNRELSAFEMTDALVSQDIPRAMGLMERLLEQNRSAEYTIIGLLAWCIRRLRKARTMMDRGVRSDQICREVRVWYRQDEFIRLVGKSSAQSLRLACKQLCEADLAVKTGASSVRNAVERFILSFASNLSKT